MSGEHVDAFPLNVDRIRAAIRDTGPAINTAFQIIAREAQYAAEQAGRFFRRLGAWVTEVHNDPVNVAGLEARYAVRAGFDPRYRLILPDDDRPLRPLVAGILAGTEDDTRFLTRENRAVVAAAAIRGWCSSYAGGDPVLDRFAWPCQDCGGHGRADYWSCSGCTGHGMEEAPYVRLHGRTLLIVTREVGWWAW